MTDASRSRPHPAGLARRATAGVATATTFGLIAAMSWPAAVPAEATEVAPELTPTVTSQPPTRIQVVVRRHIQVPNPPVIIRREAPATVRQAAAPAPAPAPRARTRSGGS